MNPPSKTFLCVAPYGAAGRHEGVPMTAATTVDRALEELIREHIPLVGHLVRETLNRVPGHVSRDDLTSAGLLALVTAAKAYDSVHGVPFTPVVAIPIKGSLCEAPRGVHRATRSG